MNNGKKKSKGLASLLGQRKFRYGGYATILTVVVSPSSFCSTSPWARLKPTGRSAWT